MTVEDRATAPAPLDVVQAFVNTRAITNDDPYAREDLATVAQLRSWLGQHTPVEVGTVTRADLALAHAVREGLRALLARHNDAATVGDDEALRRLDESAAKLPLWFSVTDDAGLRPAATRSAAAALAWILTIAVDSRVDGRWQRLKACRDEHCREAFYDASKNQSRTWCSMRVCGIRAKNRVFIERRRARSHAT